MTTASIGPNRSVLLKATTPTPLTPGLIDCAFRGLNSVNLCALSFVNKFSYNFYKELRHFSSA